MAKKALKEEDYSILELIAIPSQTMKVAPKLKQELLREYIDKMIKAYILESAKISEQDSAKLLENVTILVKYLINAIRITANGTVEGFGCDYNAGMPDLQNLKQFIEKLSDFLKSIANYPNLQAAIVVDTLFLCNQYYSNYGTVQTGEVSYTLPILLHIIGKIIPAQHALPIIEALEKKTKIRDTFTRECIQKVKVASLKKI